MKQDGRNNQGAVRGICDEKGQLQESAPHPKQVLYVDLDAEAEAFDILRVEARS